jgi:endonuclease/exonuclease/phosphatase family metal-dependent hydrolase
VAVVRKLHRASSTVALVDLKVMTYNVQGHGSLLVGSYLRRIARVIADEKPDLVGLQEVYRGGWRARFADQAEALARETGMTVHFGRSFGGGGGGGGDVGRGGRRGRTGEFGNALLAAGEVRSVEVHPLPGAGEPRTVLESRVVVRGTELRFLVTHLAAWGRLGRAARGRQVEALAAQLRRTAGPFVLVGDLNAPPDAPELGHLMATDLFRACGELASTHRMTRQHLDYVFADRGWTPVASRVLRRGPSDHWPVVVDLRRAA